MQVTMPQLAIAVVVVEVVGNRYVCRDSIATYKTVCHPAFVKRSDGATSFALWFRETDLRAAHRYAGGNGNASLLVIVDSTIEVVHDPIVLHHITLMGKHFVVWFRGPDEVFTLPTLPVQQVARDGKGVEGIVLA